MQHEGKEASVDGGKREDETRAFGAIGCAVGSTDVSWNGIFQRQAMLIPNSRYRIALHGRNAPSAGNCTLYFKPFVGKEP